MIMALHNDVEIDTDDIPPGALMHEIAEMLAQQGFDVRGPGNEDDRELTITNAPKGRCEIEVSDSGFVNCEYTLRAGEHAHPADISRAVLRLMAAPTDELPGPHAAPHQQISLKTAVGRELRARGLTVDLWLSSDTMDCNVYAGVEITNPQQPDRGTVSVSDDGLIWWECDADELSGQAREIVMTLTDMLAPPVPPASVSA
jgi:hypothetical protein